MNKSAFKYLREAFHVGGVLILGGMFGISIKAENNFAFYLLLVLFVFAIVHAMTYAAENARAEAKEEFARQLIDALTNGEDTNINVTIETRAVAAVTSNA